MERQPISQAEWQVMRVLWAYPHSRSTEIVAHLESDFDWKPATVKTLLNRLKSKEWIGMEKIQGKFYYDALLPEEEHLTHIWQSLFDNMCASKHGELLLSILEAVQFSQEDLERIQQLAREKQRRAPEAVDCCCPEGQCRCERHSH